MHRTSPIRARLLQPTLQIVCLGAMLSAAVVGAVTWALLDARDDARRQAEQAAGNIALTVEHEIERATGALDLSMRAAVEGMAIANLAGLQPEARQAILFDGAIAAGGVDVLAIADATGQIIYNSVGPTPVPVNIGDREYFQARQADPEMGLLLGRPIVSRFLHEWVIPVSRRVNHADGSFAGVVTAGLKLSTFVAMFDALDIGRKGIVTLLRTDGGLIARRPFDAGDVGRPLAKAEMLRLVSEHPSGVIEATAQMDGVRRLYSYRKIGDLPLILFVGLATQEIYADWAEKAMIFGSVLLLLLLLALGLTMALLRGLRRRDDAERVARESAREHAAALARLDALFQNSTDAMFVVAVEPEGRFRYESVNPVWQSVKGLPAHAAIGQSPQDCLPGELVGIVAAAWSQCVRERRPTRYLYTTSRSGASSDWEAAVVPVIDESGRVQRLIGVARDMTERNRLQSSLLQAQRMEAIGQLTSGLAHDFNNLLQAILSAMELLREQRQLDDEGGQCIDIAQDAARHGATLVHHLLAFSRKQALAPVLLRPDQVLPELAGLLARTLGGNIHVDTRIEGAPWPIFADRPELNNCLLNLALNARDAMPEGGLLRIGAANVSLAVADEAGLPPGDYLRLTIEDEGVGMPPQTVARAFEPFFSTKGVGQGAGLGLSLVHGFARQSGGDARITSVQGRGTIVSLWLPRAYAVSIITPEIPAFPVTAVPDSGRVLLVDDEAAVRQALSMTLTKAGFNPVAVASGAAALDLLSTGGPWDALVTDQSMPGMTGTELIGAAARIAPALPTMLITGFDKVNGIDDFAGCVTVLRKPFKRVDFLRQLQALLDASAARADARAAAASPALAPADVS